MLCPLKVFVRPSHAVSEAPKLAVGDGALGFWAALEEVFPQTREQRFWVHKTANILDKLPKKLHPSAKKLIHETYGQSFLVFFFLSFFLWTKLGLFLFFPFAFVFSSAISHICSSLRLPASNSDYPGVRRQTNRYSSYDPVLLA